MVRSSILGASILLNVLIQHLPLQSLFWMKTWRAFRASDPSNTYADYAILVVDRRSTSGYCTFLGGSLITWRSKKQKVVARSSVEAEFHAMSHGICEVIWVK